MLYRLYKLYELYKLTDKDKTIIFQNEFKK